MAWLFTEYDVARNSQVLHWTFSIVRATSYSVNSQVTVPMKCLKIYSLHIEGTVNKRSLLRKIFAPFDSLFSTWSSSLLTIFYECFLADSKQ